MPPRSADAELNRVLKALKKVKANWLRRKGVVAIGYGSKTIKKKRGYQRGEKEVLSIIVTVEEKIGKKALPAARLFPSEVQGVPVDVQEMGRKGKLCVGGPNDPPLPDILGGAAICLSQQFAQWGTLGLVVHQRNAGIRGLSCAHVLMHHVGGAFQNFPGDQVYQPPQNLPTNVVGTPGPNLIITDVIDAALVVPNSRPWIRGELLGFPTLEVTSFLRASDPPPAWKAPVAKFGQRTGFTEGTVDAVGVAETFIPAGLLTDLIRIKPTNGPFAAGGDSGSLLVFNPLAGDTELTAIGMVVGVEGQFAYATPLHPIFGTLRLSL